ncbi:MAG: hypothetical protein OHK0015_30120 [Chloroflexi bacterium OHK40]
MAMIIQLLLIGIWGAIVTRHTRRLYRLAVVPAIADRARFVRDKARRMWWWLGRDEFLGTLQRDTLRCVEATVMVGVIALGF